jgi:hypothetical protein
VIPRRATMALTLLIVVSGCRAGVTSAPEASPQPITSVATPRPIPAGDGPIDPGTHRIAKSAWSVADFAITMPDGWTVQYGHVFHKHSDAPDELGLYAVVVDQIYADACAGSTGDLVKPGPSVDDLAGAVLQQAGPKASGPVATTLGGYPATRIDLVVPDRSDLAPCNLEGIGLQIWYSRPADKYFVLLPDTKMSVYILDIGGQRQVFLAGYGSATSDEDVAELKTIIDSIRIQA